VDEFGIRTLLSSNACRCVDADKVIIPSNYHSVGSKINLITELRTFTSSDQTRAQSLFTCFFGEIRLDH